MSELINIAIDTSTTVKGYITKGSTASLYVDIDDIIEIRAANSAQCLLSLSNGNKYTVNQTASSLAASVNSSYTAVVNVNIQTILTVKGYSELIKNIPLWIGAQHVVEVRPIDSSTSKIILETGDSYIGLEDDLQLTLAQRLSVPYGGGGGGGISALTSDVNASGTGTVSATVVAIQGNNVSSAAPLNGQYLRWNTNANQWVPTTVAIPDFYVHMALNEIQTGATELHIGSCKLDAGSTILSTSAAMIGCTTAQDTAYLRLRRFTGGAIVATWTKVGLLGEVNLGQTISISSTDWYDLYLYSGGVDQTAIVKGLRISYTN